MVWKIDNRDQLRRLIDRTDNLRLVSVVGHSASGKTTLTNALRNTAGVVLDDGDGTVVQQSKSSAVTNWLLYQNDEGQRPNKDEGDDEVCKTEQATEEDEWVEISSQDLGNVAEAMRKEAPGEPEKDFSTQCITSDANLIQLLDTQGTDRLEVTATARITDGALIVVDATAMHASMPDHDYALQTITRKVTSEQVKPVLFLNKVDQALLDHELPSEELYQAFHKAIELVNTSCTTMVSSAPCAQHEDDKEKTVQDINFRVAPRKGTVVFGSSCHQWAFTLTKFAKYYSAKFGIPQDKMLQKLWGDWYYDTSHKSWTQSNPGGTLQRGFCQFILTPIVQMCQAIRAGKYGKVKKMLQAIHVTINVDSFDDDRESLLEKVMQRWLSISNNVLETIVLQLPSPVKAQQYRVATLYDGPLNDKTATAIRTCDKSTDAPLCMYISKMIPMPMTTIQTDTPTTQRRFYAFGRVFSGTITAGQKVRIMGRKAAPGWNGLYYNNSDIWVKNVQQTVILLAKGGTCITTASVMDVPAGNLCALEGLDQYLFKSGTIVTEEDAHSIRPIKPVTAVVKAVRCTIEPQVSADLPRLVDAIKSLARTDPSVSCYSEELSGDFVVATSSEEDLEKCLQDLKNDSSVADINVKVSDPFVPFRETCFAKSSETCLGRSANRHISFFFEAEPLGPELSMAIDDGSISAAMEPNKLSYSLSKDFGWDATEARRIWAFAPEGTGPNMFVDTTKGVNYLLEVKEGIVGGFNWATCGGPLCDEPMRGCRFNLMDVVMNVDAIHRGIGQTMPCSRRACFSSMMMADPHLLEPVYSCNIEVSQDAMDPCYGVLTRRRGHVFAEEQRPGAPLWTLSAYLPVMESFGFITDILSSTGGKAFSQCSFSHWEPMSGSPYDANTKAAETIRNIRARKGLDEEVPEKRKYLDKL